MKKLTLPKFFSTPWGIAACFTAAFIPSLIAIFVFLKSHQTLQSTECEIELLSSKARRNAFFETQTQKLLKKLASADPYYLEKSLESARFLEREIQKLEAAGEEKRLAHLKGGGNTLSFAELGLQRLDGFQEVEARQKHPVELDGDDLKELLNRIEGENPHSPQLIIKQLELIRKPTSNQDEVFLINLELIKREKIK